MAENRLATTIAQGYRRLGMRGQPLIAAHSQLAQILRNRLGREHAELFALPNLDPTTGSIEWFTSRAGPPTLVSTLEAQQRASLQALTDQLLREVEQLAGKLKREGDTAELASQMLSGALQRPPGDWLYEVGGKPVLIMWGHVPEGSPNVQAGAADATAPVLVPGPAGGIATTKPDGGGAGIGGPGITARSGAGTGPGADAGTTGSGAAGPGTTVPGSDPDKTGAPADPANPGRALPPVALGPEGPVDPGRLPELPPPDTGKPLTIPPDAPRDGKPSFLQGNWSAGPGLTSTKNKPIDLSLVLGDDGKGQVVIRRKDDGSTCVGPVDAQMRQGRLAVTGSGAVLCNRGEPFEMPRFECAPDARGRTQCNGINRDGSTYEMDIYQGRRS